jgi:hypothetical protein
VETKVERGKKGVRMRGNLEERWHTIMAIQPMNPKPKGRGGLNKPIKNTVNPGDSGVAQNTGFITKIR